jgi:hypothetical protein
MSGAAIALAEAGLVPERWVRAGIRRLLRRRLADEDPGTPALRGQKLARWLETMRSSPIALAVEAANEQHYEVPPRFFELVLGPRLKYSGALFERAGATLAEAEEAMLAHARARPPRRRPGDPRTWLRLGLADALRGRAPAARAHHRRLEFGGAARVHPAARGAELLLHDAHQLAIGHDLRPADVERRAGRARLLEAGGSAGSRTKPSRPRGSSRRAGRSPAPARLRARPRPRGARRGARRGPRRARRSRRGRRCARLSTGRRQRIDVGDVTASDRDARMAAPRLDLELARLALRSRRSRGPATACSSPPCRRVGHVRVHRPNGRRAREIDWI